MKQFESGEKIGRYKIKSILSQGGMGIVYKAKDTTLGRHVAIKTVLSDDVRDRFELEAKALAKLSHENIVSIFDYGYYEDISYIVMELVPGVDLVSFSKQCIYAVNEFYHVFKQAIEGLDSLHSSNIIHRDIKPANMLLTSSLKLKIVDLGAAHSKFNSNVKITKPNHLIGTVSYIAPELFSGEKPSAKTDIYALGLSFAEFIMGENIFTGENTLETLENIRTKQVEFLPTDEIILTDKLIQVIYKMIAKDPQLRYASTAEIFEDLEKFDLDSVHPFLKFPYFFNFKFNVSKETIQYIRKLEAFSNMGQKTIIGIAALLEKYGDNKIEESHRKAKPENRETIDITISNVTAAKDMSLWSINAGTDEETKTNLLDNFAQSNRVVISNLMDLNLKQFGSDKNTEISGPVEIDFPIGEDSVSKNLKTKSGSIGKKGRSESIYSGSEIGAGTAQINRSKISLKSATPETKTNFFAQRMKLGAIIAISAVVTISVYFYFNTDPDVDNAVKSVVRSTLQFIDENFK